MDGKETAKGFANPDRALIGHKHGPRMPCHAVLPQHISHACMQGCVEVLTVPCCTPKHASCQPFIQLQGQARPQRRSKPIT